MRRGRQPRVKSRGTRSKWFAFSTGGLTRPSSRLIGPERFHTIALSRGLNRPAPQDYDLISKFLVIQGTEKGHEIPGRRHRSAYPRLPRGEQILSLGQSMLDGYYWFKYRKHREHSLGRSANRVTA